MLYTVLVALIPNFKLVILQFPFLQCMCIYTKLKVARVLVRSSEARKPKREKETRERGRECARPLGIG
jgi:hypothetical protein